MAVWRALDRHGLQVAQSELGSAVVESTDRVLSPSGPSSASATAMMLASTTITVVTHGGYRSVERNSAA